MCSYNVSAIEFYSVNSRGFLEFATPSLHYNFVVIILHVLSFYPAQVTQLVEYEGSSPF